LDEALLDRRIDLAVHSAKDLPTELPIGIVLACAPEREDARDAFISLKARAPADLARGAVIGSASLRRQAQLLHKRPDLKMAVLRGNVETRLRKIESGEFDGTFLALAGLKRLGLDRHASSVIEIEDMPPAAGQGALAITSRDGDSNTLVALQAINSEDTMVALSAERGFLLALDGSCRTAIGAYAARRTGQILHMIGEVLSPDGAVRFRETGETALPLTVNEAIVFGIAVAHALKEKAGAALPSSV
jgi:hydroxymethylbilane synthase